MRSKFFLSVFFYLFIAIGFLVSPKSTIAGGDHGSDYLTATDIVVGTTVNGDIEPLDIDYFSFSAVSGTTYTIMTTIVTLPAEFSNLYGTDGITNLFVTGNPMVWTCPIDGKYFISVAGVSSVDTGTYTLSVTAFRPVLTASASDSTFTLTWDANVSPSHFGYSVHIGTQRGVYDLLSINVSDALTYTATGLTNNTTYYATVTFYDESQEFSYPYTGEIAVTPYSVTTDFMHDYTGGPASYVMMAFPVILTDTDPVNNLGPILNPAIDPASEAPYTYDPNTWRIYTYYGNAYHQPPDAATQIQPGRGYWVVSLNNASINLTGDTVDSSGDFVITVPTGWYMIGNPFNFTVDVAELRVSDGGGDEVKVIDGIKTLPNLYYYENDGYVTVTQMLPNGAYWIKNTSGADITLKIPPIAVVTGGAAATVMKVPETAEAPPPPPSGDPQAADEKGMCFIAAASYDTADQDFKNTSALEWLFNVINIIE
jgi:hypothetical protein